MASASRSACWPYVAMPRLSIDGLTGYTHGATTDSLTASDCACVPLEARLATPQSTFRPRLAARRAARSP
jgi:hypothetical protein